MKYKFLFLCVLILSVSTLADGPKTRREPKQVAGFSKLSIGPFSELPNSEDYTQVLVLSNTTVLFQECTPSECVTSRTEKISNDQLREIQALAKAALEQPKSSNSKYDFACFLIPARMYTYLASNIIVGSSKEPCGRFTFKNESAYLLSTALRVLEFELR